MKARTAKKNSPAETVCSTLMGLPFFETRMPNIWRLACSEAFASKRVVWGDTVTVLARNAILLVGTREKQSRPTGCACSPTGSGGDFLRVPDTNHHPILPEIMQQQCLSDWLHS